MRSNDLNPCDSHIRHNYSIKMTKTRTVTFLMMIISTCALILSLTTAYPTTEVATESNSTDIADNSNSSVKFAITHIVKTIEFQVSVLQDDGIEPGNATDVTTQEYMETDIKLLNVDLLRELLSRASTDDDEPATKAPENEVKGDSVAPTKLQNSR